MTTHLSPATTCKVAPLPFVGQKRMFLRHFVKALKDNITNDGDGWTVIDVFGGSGLLAHNAKRILPKADVIYNDFDGYSERLKHIATTNRLRQELFGLTKDMPPAAKLPPSIKTKVLDHIRQHASDNDFIDAKALASWLLFSGKQASSIDELFAYPSFYNHIKKTDYSDAGGYLDGLTVVHLDFEQLLQKYQNTPNCLLVLDPPYLYTKQKAYNLHKKGGYFGMTKFLRLMQFVKAPFIFFSSTKSELLDYMAYVKQYEPDTWNRIGAFDRVVVRAPLNVDISYEDNMLIKF